MANNASSVLAIAAAEVGYSRWNDPEPGTKYGRWYEQQIDRTSGNYDFGASGVPYCAMFVSWTFAQAGASCAGFPGAYCPSILTTGKARGKAVPTASAQPGDVVLFDWEGDGTSDHVGFVEANSGGVLRTIEGNTNNGCVARRTRSYGTVVGIIRPDYNGQASSESTTTGGLEVDGLWGAATTRALQAALETVVDGIVSDQYAGCKDANPGLMASSWEWRNPSGDGSSMVRALQKKLGVTVDGCAGDETFTALQRYLGTTQDGHISKPSLCVKELQRRLNAGSF